MPGLIGAPVNGSLSPSTVVDGDVDGDGFAPSFSPRTSVGTVDVGVGFGEGVSPPPPVVPSARRSTCGSRTSLR